MVITINGRALEKFDFDSEEPVKGEEYRKPLGLVPVFIDYLAVCDVILFGAWLCKWWYYGGFGLMYHLFSRYLPWLLNMTQLGQL